MKVDCLEYQKIQYNSKQNYVSVVVLGLDSIIGADKARKTTVFDLMDSLSSNESGLSTSEAKARLKQYGPNEIWRKKSIRL